MRKQKCRYIQWLVLHDPAPHWGELLTPRTATMTRRHTEESFWHWELRLWRRHTEESCWHWELRPWRCATLRRAGDTENCDHDAAPHWRELLTMRTATMTRRHTEESSWQWELRPWRRATLRRAGDTENCDHDAAPHWRELLTLRTATMTIGNEPRVVQCRLNCVNRNHKYYMAGYCSIVVCSFIG